MHAAVVRSQARPASSSQPGPTSCFESHATPTLAPVAWHVPFVAPDGVTHVSEKPHGSLGVHPVPSAPGAWHVVVEATHR